MVRQKARIDRVDGSRGCPKALLAQAQQQIAVALTSTTGGYSSPSRSSVKMACGLPTGGER